MGLKIFLSWLLLQILERKCLISTTHAFKWCFFEIVHLPKDLRTHTYVWGLILSPDIRVGLVSLRTGFGFLVACSVKLDSVRLVRIFLGLLYRRTTMSPRATNSPFRRRCDKHLRNKSKTMLYPNLWLNRLPSPALSPDNPTYESHRKGPQS